MSGWMWGNREMVMEGREDCWDREMEWKLLGNRNRRERGQDRWMEGKRKGGRTDGGKRKGTREKSLEGDTEAVKDGGTKGKWNKVKIECKTRK